MEYISQQMGMGMSYKLKAVLLSNPTSKADDIGDLVFPRITPKSPYGAIAITLRLWINTR